MAIRKEQEKLAFGGLDSEHDGRPVDEADSWAKSELFRGGVRRTTGHHVASSGTHHLQADEENQGLFDEGRSVSTMLA